MGTPANTDIKDFVPTPGEPSADVLVEANQGDSTDTLTEPAGDGSTGGVEVDSGTQVAGDLEVVSEKAPAELEPEHA